MAALQEAARNPVARPYNPAKLAYKPKALDSAIGSVVIPETEPEPQQAAPKEISAHTEIQSLLAKLGNDIGLDVWVARNDRNKDVGGKRFTELTGLKSDLPLQFDDATNKTMESIDILWMQKHSIVAAFEIESTTSVSRFTVDFTQSVRHAPVRSCSPTVSGIAG